MSQLYPGDLLEGRYRLGAQIAKGGMSTVYIAVDTRLDREVAVKVMDPSLATEPTFRTRFEREARAVARLNNPTLVNVFDQGVDGEFVYIVMELVEGGSLRELLCERGPMPPHAAMAVMQPVLTALSIAHTTGMIHRDIKPDNVLISDRHRVKLADFGLVRAANALGDRTTGQVIGTVGYLSPEQVRGEKLEQSSDVYSAGILLFELLTGTTPFRRDTPTETAMARLHQAVPAPSEFIDGIPETIDQLVRRACHQDASQRFADGGEFLDELTQVVKDLGIPAFNVPAPKDSAVRRALENTDFGERRAWDDESMHTRAVPLPPQPGPATSQTALQNYQPPVPPTAPGPAAHAPVPATVSPAGSAPPRQPMPSAVPAAPEPRKAPAKTLTNRSPVASAIWILTIIILVIAIALGAWWLTSGRYGEIPEVVGMDPTSAQVTVEEAGFTSALEERYDNSAEANTALGTDPPFGERAPRGSQVAVLVSLGKPTVPELGPAESVTSYKRKLEGRTLQLAQGTQVYSQDVAAGHIAKVSPGAGTTVDTYSTVTVQVSKGPKPVKMPDVKGKEREAAIRALEKTGLRVTNVVEEFSEKHDRNKAIRTDPATGTQVPGKSEVTLYISNAIKVPDVEDKSLEEAVRILQDAGLTPIEGSAVQDRGVDAGDVASQSPSPGTRINPAADTTVELRVSNAQRVPFLIGQTGDAARQKLEELGFEVRIDGDNAGRVYSQSPGPGTTSSRGAEVTISTL